MDSLNSSLDGREKRYFEVLATNVLPFEKYVSRGDLKDLVDIPSTHSHADRKVERTLKSLEELGTARFFPIVGEAGAGKTHYYWCLKAQAAEVKRLQASGERGLVTRHVVYVPSPPAPVRIYSHILTCILDEYGDDVIEDISKNLVKEFYQPGDSFVAIHKRASKKYGGFAADLVKAFLYLGLPDEALPGAVDRDFVEYWIMGESLNEEEARALGLRPLMEEDEDLVFTFIRLIFEHSSHKFILYFDEMELIYRVHGPEAEVRYWEVIKQIYNNCKNLIIITTCLQNVWTRVLDNLDATVTSRFEPEVRLKPFTLADMHTYYRLAMKEFWERYGLEYPENTFYPLDEQSFTVILNKSKGNPRTTIRLIQAMIEKVIEGQVPSATAFEERKELPPARILEEDETLSPVERGTPLGPKQGRATIVRICVGDEAYDMDLTPTTMISAVSMILRHATALLESVEIAEKTVELNKKIRVRRTVTTLPLVFTDDTGRNVGVVVPQWKYFTQKSKGASYYALVTLTDALKAEQIDQGLLLVPKIPLTETRGPELESIFPEYRSHLKIISFTEEEAIEFVETAFKSSTNTPFPDYHFPVIHEKYASMSLPDLKLRIQQAMKAKNGE